MTKFKVGDHVIFDGCRGVVTELYKSIRNPDYRIAKVLFRDGEVLHFDKDGTCKLMLNSIKTKLELYEKN